MSIAVQVRGNDPSALAELIAATMQGGIVLDREANVAHLSALVAAEEREAATRRAAWAWLNALTKPAGSENDWSDV